MMKEDKIGKTCVAVYWIDASVPSDPLEQCNNETADTLTPCIMEDVGWLIADEPDYISIASQKYSIAGEYRRRFTVPKKNIVKLYIMNLGMSTSKYNYKPKKAPRKTSRTRAKRP